MANFYSTAAAAAVAEYAAEQASEQDALRWEAEQEEARWREETIAWLDDPSNWSCEEYSDIFKDVYGFRPRFMRGRGYWSY